MDLKDLEMKRPPIGRSALRERVKRLLRTRKAKEVAKNTVLGLKKVCQMILRKRMLKSISENYLIYPSP